MAGTTCPSSGAKTRWERARRRTVVANACGNIASCEYYSLDCICRREEFCVVASMEEAHRARGGGSQSAYFAQRMPLNFFREYEGFLASLGMTALEFSSEPFESWDPKVRFPLSAQLPGF